MPLKAVQRTTGDAIADRRFAYASAAFVDADWQAAADLAGQTLELTPDFAPAHAMLGRALAALGRGEAAAEALKQALALDPEDELGVRIDLARLGALDPSEALSEGYVRALFDQYAGEFDKHLTEDLHYRGPEVLRSAVLDACAALGREPRFAHAIDLGCGTGLAGRGFAELAGRLTGVDLSPAMIEKARATGRYAELHVADAVDFLTRDGSGKADLIIAADVLVYIGDLFPVFREAVRSLAPGGLFAFTVQDHGGSGFTLGYDSRYHHSDAYLRAVAAEAGLRVVISRDASTRSERGLDQPGRVSVLQRPE